MSESVPSRRRNLDTSRDRALLDATLTVLAESGYGGLTTAAVAARAGASTATLYRRWSSKENLVIAAASTFAPELATSPSTGTLHGDLRALLRDVAIALSGAGGRLIRALIGEAAHNLGLADALATVFLTPVRRRVDESVERAVNRGQIAPIDDADLPGDLVIGLMVSRFLLTPMLPDPVDASAKTRMADALLPFLLRAVVNQGDRGVQDL
jgi:AcrR family transcriptional regulator